MNHRSAFTLIELLVVIAIIAILSVVVILVLNPTQLLMQGRDSNRVSDMATMNTALGVYAAQGGSSLGSPNVVYVSIPDPTATSTAGDQCQGLGLPTLPSAYTYQCAATSTYRSVNGSGWVPINFTTLSGGSPLGQLPTDPVNTTSSRLYYTYDTNGSQYEMTSVMESQKYGLGGSNDVIGTDGGTLASVYERGTKFGLEPLDYGDNSLVGWWPLTEGTGTIAYDSSGNNATGSWNGTPTGTNGYYSAGKVGSYAGAFDGSTDYVAQSGALPLALTSYTMALWLEPNTTILTNVTITFANAGNPIRLSYNGTAFTIVLGPSATFVLPANSWTFYAITYNGSQAIVYVNSAVNTSGSFTFSGTPSNFIIGKGSAFPGFPGLIDDVRIYNRALSAAQVAAMYNGGK